MLNQLDLTAIHNYCMTTGLFNEYNMNLKCTIIRKTAYWSPAPKPNATHTRTKTYKLAISWNSYELLWDCVDTF